MSQNYFLCIDILVLSATDIIMLFFFVRKKRDFHISHQTLAIPRPAAVGDLLNKMLLTSKKDCSTVANKRFVGISWIKMKYAEIMKYMSLFGKPQQADPFRSLAEQ